MAGAMDETAGTGTGTATSPNPSPSPSTGAGERLISSSRLEGMSPAQRAALEARLGKTKKTSVADPIVSVPRDGDLAVSAAQRRLWFMDQLSPGSAVFNVSTALRFTGPLDLPALTSAIRTLIHRHESLRTTLPTVNGEPVQRILPNLPIDLVPETSTDTADALTADALTAALAAEAGKPFELSAGPLFRPKLFRVSAEEHVLQLTVHHSVCDGWSMSILVDELLALYAASDAADAALPEQRLQYADYAAWEALPERAARWEEDLTFWREALRGAPPVIDLPFDRPRPAVQSFRGARHRFELPGAIWTSAREIARAERATPLMVLAAGFTALLSRYSGQDEVVMVTPGANRPRVEFESMVGFFANSIALRCDASGSPTFLELVRRVRDTARQAIAHGEVPFERVVEAADPVRDPSHAPLAQVLFAVVDDPALDVTLDRDRLHVGDIELDNGTAKYDFSLELWPDASGTLQCVFEYATDLFDTATVARIADHLGTLLGDLTQAPEKPVTAARLMSEAESASLLVEFNRTDDPLLGDVRAHELFEQQARSNPDAPALISPDRTLTFAELDTRADRLADRLRGAGVGPEARVALFLERGVDLVTSVLAVLKAGGAYVPLDVSEPADRVAFMIADAAVQVVMTDTRHVDSLGTVSAPVLLLTDVVDLEGEDDRDRDHHRDRPAAENAAYIIYTSGSTGRPKGVLITHGALTNYLAWSVRAYRVAEGAGAPLVSPLRFDLSVTTFFGPLLAGRPVTLVPEGTELDTLTTTFGTDVGHGLIKLTPAHLDALDGAVPQKVVAGSGYLIVGGESLHGKTVAAWRERVPGLRVVNEYGPTEATVGCCVYEVDDTTDLSGTVPIGRPIANTRIYVLDENLAPVVRGAVGELYVGGAGLARGYWNRPELTAERFIPDPFGPPGSRLYRTGDLARIRPDGQLDCLGRADTQVKVRGYRVELEEIEASLTRLPDVREALVLLRQDTPGLRRLVAYVSGTGTDRPLVEADLRSALRQDLPDYMIPDAVVVMDALPLASNGKVDRRALPRPAAAAEAAVQDAPQQASWLERTIAQVWSDVLRVPSVPHDVSFLELGGHSLLAVQAMARLRKALDIDLPLTVFLEAKSVSDLAARIEALGGPAARPGLVTVDPAVPVPLSYAQGRLYFLNRLAEDSAFYNVPMALRFDGAFDSAAFGQAVAALWERHGALRTRFPLRDGEPVQELLPVDALTIAEVDLQATPGEAADQPQRLKALMREEAARPFDLENGPLLRCTLVRLAPDAHVVLMTLHHVVSDGWSLSLILDDLMAFYRAFAADRQPDLEPIPFTYLDYTQWQRSWFSGPDMELQLGYWRDQLSGAPALTLPTDRPRPAVQSFRGARHEVAWSKELSDRVAALARREGVSLFMALLAGFDVLMARSSGQRDITVGTPIANRTLTELEKIVGFFANTLALRVDLSGDPSFTDVLARVKQAANGAYAHQDVPFEMVVDAVAPTRSLSYSPLFQVRFALQNANTDLPDAGPGLVLSEIDNDQVTARFDLMVDLWESENGIEGHAEYSTDLFDAETVELLMRRLEALFERLVRDPAQRVFAMDILLPEERERLDALGRGSWPEADGAGEHRGFIERLREQAAANPDEPAVTCGSETITYEALFARSTAWAGELAKRGVAADTMVGVYLERGVDFVVAALAILRAGGAYVPLDTAYPEARLAAVVADAKPVVVLTTKALAPTAPGGPDSVLVLEDAFAGVDESKRPTAALPLPDLDDPAYVVYTSGTHGQPKGVVVTHRSLAAYLDALPTALHLPEAPVFLHTASFAFSSSVRQLTVPLALGGHVVIAAREQLADPQQLVAYASEHDVDVLDLVPSYLRAAAPALIETAGSRWRPRMILTASEPLLYDLPEAIREGLGAGVRLVNMYGQTETTGIVATARVGAGREGRGAVVPLGRPVPGTTVHILDEALEPVPVGQPGEIVIGGSSLARGYLNDPELTAQRFIGDPSAPVDVDADTDAQRRLYRTGDLGRFLPNGKLEFLGRIGDQVKIRGHRVEPAEVASVLSRCEGVGECAVICVELGADERRLIGYVAGRPGTSPTVAFLRAELKAKLPDYMVPSLVMLDELPHLPNGKVDRAALAALGAPQAGSDGTDAGDASRAPRTEVEQTLLRIWQEVLRQDRIGPHDDFFTSGGDSLHVIRVVERARKAGIIITPAQFIANPTIAELAEVAGKPAAAAASGVAEADAPVLVPSHLAFMDRDYDGKHLYTHIFSYTLLAPLEAAVVRQAVECLLEHHPSLRISFPPEGDSRRVVINEPFDKTPFTAVDLSALGPQEQDTAFLRLDRTLHRKIDFDHGPLVHFALVHFGGDRPDQVLAIVHHQLVDNSSWEVIAEDLETACVALAEGKVPELRPTTGSFAQWSRNLDALARSAELEADIPYWTELAKKPRPQWPADYPDGDDLLSLERDVSVRLDEQDFALLRRRMPAEYGLTVNQTLLAALLVGYTEWSGQNSVHVDLVGRGRELGGADLDLTRAIGRFPVTSPRLLERPATSYVPSLLRDVARQLAEVPRAGLGFGLLRYFDVHPEVAAALEPLDRPDIILINWGEQQTGESASPLFADGVEVEWPMPAVQRTHRLKAFARTVDGGLVFTLSYSEKLNDRERIEQLAELVGAALRSFVREDDGRPGSEHGEDARI